MDLSTCASRLLHRCRENDTIYVLKQQTYFCCVAAVYNRRFWNFLCDLKVTAAKLRLCFVIEGSAWWTRTFPPMAPILALHHEHM